MTDINKTLKIYSEDERHDIAILTVTLASRLHRDGFFAVAKESEGTVVVLDGEKKYAFLLSKTETKISEMNEKYVLPACRGISYLEGVIHSVVFRSSEVRIKEAAVSYVNKAGVKSYLSGYQMLVTAICFCVKDPHLVTACMKRLYPKIAEIYQTSVSSVERDIRHALESAYRLDDKKMNQMFCYPVAKPTCSEFIAFVSNKICEERRIF